MLLADSSEDAVSDFSNILDGSSGASATTSTVNWNQLLQTAGSIALTAQQQQDYASTNAALIAAGQPPLTMQQYASKNGIVTPATTTQASIAGASNTMLLVLGGIALLAVFAMRGGSN